MRVLLTIHHPSGTDGGAPAATAALAQAMRAAGCQVELLSHDQLPRWARGTLSILAFPVLVAWSAMVGRHRWDVVDFASYDGWLATWLPRRLRPPVLAFHSHGLEHVAHERLMVEVRRGAQRVSWRYGLYRGSVHLWMVARAARQADVAFFLNADERDHATTHLGVRPSRAILAINGIDDAFLAAAAAVAGGDPDRGPLNVAFVGTYIDRKGIAYLMPALAGYLARHPAARAALLGTRADAGRVLRDLPPSLHDRVRVVPSFARNALPALLADCHVFVLPSLAEGFSLAGLEAMACGLVPILTRGHGFEAYAVDGESGFLIDRGNHGQILDALERLDADRDLWRRMRDRAAQVARTFTWRRAAAVQLAGYDRAAGVVGIADQGSTATPSGARRDASVAEAPLR